MVSLLKSAPRRISDFLYTTADHVFLPLERSNIDIGHGLAPIPARKARRGGTFTVTEWGFTIGVFQALIHMTAGQRDNLDILDVGCGSGRLSMASIPLMGDNGHYVGIDVSKADLETARRHFSDPRISFQHLDVANRAYAAGQKPDPIPYDVEDASFDVATALSVWTHLNERDATYYMGEVARALRPGGKAIITFFLLDNDYRAFDANRPTASAYHRRDPAMYSFTESVDGSAEWRCPKWAATVPERIIGVTMDGLDRLAEQAGLEIEGIHPGYWKERPGLFIQDVVTFRRPQQTRS